MTDDVSRGDGSPGTAVAAALAAADGHFAKALCDLIGEARTAGTVDPERLALELEFAVRGCYFQPDPVADEALRARGAALLEAAGGTTRLAVEFGAPPGAQAGGGKAGPKGFAFG